MARPTPDFVAQLTAASTEGREVISELRSELKEARRVIQELKGTVIAEAQSAAAGAVTEALKPELENCSRVITERQRALEKATMAGIERIILTLLTGDPQGRGPNIIDEIKRGWREAGVD